MGGGLVLEPPQTAIITVSAWIPAKTFPGTERRRPHLPGACRVPRQGEQRRARSPQFAAILPCFMACPSSSCEFERDVAD